MSERRRVRPKSRKAWRGWLEKNHASSKGVWLVYAKKHSGLPSLTYNDAVEEALCFGWIDSKINPIDDVFYMQVFTPRKRESAWSALNRARVERLLAAGLMTAAGLMVVKSAKELGTWNAMKHVEELTIPPDLKKAIKANPGRQSQLGLLQCKQAERRALPPGRSQEARDPSQVPSGHH